MNVQHVSIANRFVFDASGAHARGAVEKLNKLHGRSKTCIHDGGFGAWCFGMEFRARALEGQPTGASRAGAASRRVYTRPVVLFERS